MSSRTTRLPQRAMAELLAEMDLRYDQINKRIKWHSAAPDVYDPGPQATAMTDIADPVVPAEMTQLAELTLDPGGWTFFASAYWAPTASSLVLGLSGIKLFQDSEVIASADSYGSVDVDVLETPLFATGSVLLTEPTLLQFKAYGKTTGAVGTSEFRELRLSAVGS